MRMWKKCLLRRYILIICESVGVQEKRDENQRSPPKSDLIFSNYEFPLAEGASVCSFYAIVDGKKIEGKIKEKEQAKDQYDDAIASGHSAYLLEEGILVLLFLLLSYIPHFLCEQKSDLFLVSEKKNVFKTSIGNLPPKGEVVITVVYVTELTFAEDKKVSILQSSFSYSSIANFIVSARIRVANQHESIS